MYSAELQRPIPQTTTHFSIILNNNSDFNHQLFFLYSCILCLKGESCLAQAAFEVPIRMNELFTLGR